MFPQGEIPRRRSVSPQRMRLISALIRMVSWVGMPLIESCLTHAVIKLKARQLRIRLFTPGLIGNQDRVVSSCWVTIGGGRLPVIDT